MIAALALLLVAGTATPGPSPAATCIECHTRVTPGVVADWRLSRHAVASVGCDACHGADHTAPGDAARARLPTPETCGRCHAERVRQFGAGKHALAWAAMNAVPTFHRQPAVLTDGLKGCGGCHAIGLKAEADVARLARVAGRGYGASSCASCHTRHVFSLEEARSPQACRGCHAGLDHPQWEMYAGSKHGVRAELVQAGVLPAGASAPTCQTCHMPGGDHAVLAAWGYLGIRLPLAGDPAWRDDQTAILKALGLLDPSGKPASMMAAAKGLRMARVTAEEWQVARDRMVETCGACHARGFASSHLERGDAALREADRLMAQAIEVVAGLYRDGLLRRSPTQTFAYPSLLQLHDAPTVIEQRLSEMFTVHRARAFQGAFHSNPEHAVREGWGEMQRDLAAIRELAAGMRRARRGR